MDERIQLTPGAIYPHTNGSQYTCLEIFADGALLERVSDQWTLIAHTTWMTPEGLIHWSYSTGGHWPK